ncbi:prepilin peptidase [Bacillus licheniformis]|nr:prepilin peptidase [Bacillus licheniformis]
MLRVPSAASAKAAGLLGADTGLSYLMQRGRCKGCQTPLSIVYPAVELSAAILFAFAGMHVGHEGELVIVLALISLL